MRKNKTRNWKHNSKDRKQYIHDGQVRITTFDSWMLVPIESTEGWLKRKTEFMDLSDIEFG